MMALNLTKAGEDATKAQQLSETNETFCRLSLPAPELGRRGAEIFLHVAAEIGGRREVEAVGNVADGERGIA